MGSILRIQNTVTWSRIYTSRAGFSEASDRETADTYRVSQGGAETEYIVRPKKRPGRRGVCDRGPESKGSSKVCSLEVHHRTYERLGEELPELTIQPVSDVVCYLKRGPASVAGPERLLFFCFLQLEGIERFWTRSPQPGHVKEPPGDEGTPL